MTNQNIQLLIFAWGKDYESKLNLTIESLLNDVIKLKKKHNVSIIFLIDQELKNLLENKLFVKLLNLEISYKTVDITNRIGKKNFFNKIQEYGFAVSRNLNSDIIIPIYSDFIFFENSLSNIVKFLTLENKKIIFQPVLCLIEENVYNKIKTRLEIKRVLNQLDFASSIISKGNIHNIQKMMLTNNNKLCLSPAWNMYFSNDNNLYINSYHNTPIAFRTELLPKKIVIEISSDQDFTNNLYNNLEHYSECYFVKDSYETLIISLKSIKDEPLKINHYIGDQKKEKIMSSAITWIQSYTNNFHKYSSNFVYVIHIKTNKKDEKIFNYFENLNDKLLA